MACRRLMYVPSREAEGPVAAPVGDSVTLRGPVWLPATPGFLLRWRSEPARQPAPGPPAACEARGRRACRAAGGDVVRRRAGPRPRRRRPSGRSRTIRFRSQGGPTFVDVQPVALSSATLDGRPVDLTRLDAGHLPIETDPGEHTLVVDAVMRYRHDGEGLHRAVDPADGRHYIYAMTFLDAAPSIFACFDQPDLKARWRLDVRTPRGLDGARQLPRHRGGARSLGARGDPPLVHLPRGPGRRALSRGPPRARRDPAGAERARARSPGTSTQTPTSCSR